MKRSRGLRRLAVLLAGVFVSLGIGAAAPADESVGASHRADARIVGPTPARFLAETDGSEVLSDGRRYVAFVPRRDARVHVYDTLRHRTRARGRRCHGLDATRGAFLIRCAAGDRLLIAASGRIVRIRGARPHEEFSAIGRHWALGADPHPRETCDPDDKACETAIVYVNWRTGARRGGLSFDPLRDLDSRRLGPIRWNNLTTVGVDPPYRLEKRDPDLVLFRGRRRLLLTRNPADYYFDFSPSLASRWATWTDRGRRGTLQVRAYRAGEGTRLAWAVHGIAKPTGLDGHRLFSRHTRYEVVMQVLAAWVADRPNRTHVARAYRLYAAPLTEAPA